MWLRYDLRNCHPQCMPCNVFKHGNYPKYTEFIINKYGLPFLQNLIKEGELTRKWTVNDLKERIEYYKNLK